MKCDFDQARFVLVPREIIEDSSLNCNVRWLIIYILSTPHEHPLSFQEIMKVGNVSKLKALAMLRKAAKSKYLAGEER